MATVDAPAPGGWINQYVIQDRQSSRAVTVPSDAPLEPEQTVWIWKHQSPNDSSRKYLKVAARPPGELSTEPTDLLTSRQNYRVREHGRGKMLTIPDGCDDDLFGAGLQVVVVREHEEGDFSHLNIIPRSVFREMNPVFEFTD